jgi:cytochrome c oxidase subunit 4
MDSRAEARQVAHHPGDHPARVEHPVPGAHEDAHPEPGAHPHPRQSEYVRIAVILTVITLVEIGVVYAEMLAPVLVPILLVLSALKFALVVLFFMHLKFDNKLFSYLFTGPLLLMIAVVLALLYLFSVAVRAVP